MALALGLVVAVLATAGITFVRIPSFVSTGKLCIASVFGGQLLLLRVFFQYLSSFMYSPEVSLWCFGKPTG